MTQPNAGPPQPLDHDQDDDQPANRCGYRKDDGEPCELPASRDDGRCHHHTDIDEQRANGGRPSKLSEYHDDILAGARQGMTLEGCARLAGVDESTLHRWINKYDDFRKSLKRARAHGELQHLQNVDDAGSRFILERSFGYTKTEERRHTGHDGGPVEVQFSEEVVETPYSSRSDDVTLDADANVVEVEVEDIDDVEVE